MPSSNFFYPSGTQTTLYNTTPGASTVFFPVTVPAGKNVLTIEVKNSGLDQNITKIQVLGYGSTTVDANARNEIASKSVTMSTGAAAYLGPGDNVNMAHLSPGQRVEIYVTLGGTPTTGDLRIDANWS